MSARKNEWRFIYSRVDIDGCSETMERVLRKHSELFDLLGGSGWELIPELSKGDVYCFRKNEDMIFQYVWKRHIPLTNRQMINLAMEKMSETANEMEKEGFRLMLLKKRYFCFMRAIVMEDAE